MRHSVNKRGKMCIIMRTTDSYYDSIITQNLHIDIKNPSSMQDVCHMIEVNSVLINRKRNKKYNVSCDISGLAPGEELELSVTKLPG